MAEKKFIRQWTVLEPFPAPQEGIRAVLGPESSLDTRKELMVGEADYAWTEIEACPDGFVNLNREFDASDQARISYAAVDVIAEKDMASEILIGSKNPAVVYVNGVMALRQGYNKEIKTARPDMKRAPIKLSRGRNTIVVKTQSAPEEWGFFAWIGGGSEVDFEPTESMAFIGSDPQSWAEAIAVIEAEDIADTNHTDLVPGRYASGDFIRMRPRENAARLCYAKAEFTLPEDAPNAVMMIRYGAALPVRVSTAVDDGEATVFALPVTGGYRNYKTVTVPLGALKAGEHTVTFRCVDSVAFHLDTFIIADGTPMGDGVRVSE
jgi:hypothetical protein